MGKPILYSRKNGTYVCDFETTVYKGQKRTDVWAAACVKLYTEDVVIYNNISALLEYLMKIKGNTLVYFHNLKFDGEFVLSYLMADLKMPVAGRYADPNDINSFTFDENDDMCSNTFKYSISDLGQWYTILIRKKNGGFLEIRDSLKLLPFSVEKIGKSFDTKHKKLSMEYKGFRYPGCIITPEEREYIANDVLVIKEALELTFSQGHTKLTIGSCCLSEFKSGFDKREYETLFPDLFSIPLDKNIYGSVSIGEYVRRSYKGGWCYVVKGKEGLKHKGCTADVNSLYPSMMSGESGNVYPVGLPKFWRGDYIPEIATLDDNYYFVRIRTRFYIKPGYLPFIQLKNNLAYLGTECLETSDFYDHETGQYYREYLDLNGNIVKATCELTLTMTDYKLFREHYRVEDFEILDGCYFSTLSGIFDAYMHKYKMIKMNSKGAIRELAKLFLNNLYGKMASSTKSSFKVARLKENGQLGFHNVVRYDKTPGYIPIGSAITSYARNFTIRAAQANYYGVDKPGFIYADTDSIHCDLSPNELKGITIHETNFCCWKIECEWDYALFVRQKTYIEHVVIHDGKQVEPYFDVKCAGMPKSCKDLFVNSITGYEYSEEEFSKLSDEEKEFALTKHELSDFKKGLVIPGKLMPRHIPGGIVLADSTYEMR